MALIVKQGFKFLDALGLSSKQEVMLFTGHSYEITRSIVIWDSIKVMNYPSIGQRFAVSLFPNQYMFKYISLLGSSVVNRLHNSNVSISILSPSAFPFVMLFSSLNQMCKITSLPASFHRTSRAKSRELTSLTELLPAIIASCGDNSSIAPTVLTYLASRVARFPTSCTWVSMGYNPFIHNPIITHLKEIFNYDRS